MNRHIAPLITGGLVGLATWLVDSVLFAYTMTEVSIWGALLTEVSALRLSLRILLLLIAVLIGGLKSYSNYIEEQKTLGLGEFKAEDIFTNKDFTKQQDPNVLSGDSAVRGESYVVKVTKNDRKALANQPVPYDEATKRHLAKKTKAKSPEYKDTLWGNLFGAQRANATQQNQSERLWQYAGWLGESLNLSLKELEDIRTLCYCHNLGRFAVGSENADDHAEVSARIIEEFPCLHGAAELIRMHHERWDGSGLYALAGLEIPLGSRIFAVAWVYDALTREDGAYRLKGEEALEMLYMYSDTALDPELVAAFIGMMGRGRILVDNTISQTA